jgi:hypothetical protein
MYALLNPCDEIELPNTTLELPGAERHEHNEEQNCERARHSQKESRVITTGGAAGTAAAVAITGTVTTATGVPITALPTAGTTTSRRISVGRGHGMWCMFCIDSGIILLLR